MEKIALHKLMDLIEDIKKVDSIILLHQSMDDSNFMIGQYESKKTMLVSQLIDELVSPPIQSEQSFSLIQQIIDKYYPAIHKGEIHYDKEINQLLNAI